MVFKKTTPRFCIDCGKEFLGAGSAQRCAKHQIINRREREAFVNMKRKLNELQAINKRPTNTETGFLALRG